MLPTMQKGQRINLRRLPIHKRIPRLTRTFLRLQARLRQNYRRLLSVGTNVFHRSTLPFQLRPFPHQRHFLRPLLTSPNTRHFNTNFTYNSLIIITLNRLSAVSTNNRPFRRMATVRIVNRKLQVTVGEVTRTQAATRMIRMRVVILRRHFNNSHLLITLSPNVQGRHLPDKILQVYVATVQSLSTLYSSFLRSNIVHLGPVAEHHKVATRRTPVKHSVTITRRRRHPILNVPSRARTFRTTPTTMLTYTTQKNLSLTARMSRQLDRFPSLRITRITFEIPSDHNVTSTITINTNTSAINYTFRQISNISFIVLIRPPTLRPIQNINITNIRFLRMTTARMTTQRPTPRNHPQTSRRVPQMTRNRPPIIKIRPNSLKRPRFNPMNNTIISRLNQSSQLNRRRPSPQNRTSLVNIVNIPSPT